VRAVVFDFDGLLMDTESTSIASWEAEWAEWGLAKVPLSGRPFRAENGAAAAR
jgi:beta-phosphoglucomutase-like phosphatase (HAD superfamily)